MNQHSELPDYHVKMWEYVRSKGIKLPEYKLLTNREYKNLCGYPKFEEVAQRIAAHIFITQDLPLEKVIIYPGKWNIATFCLQLAQVQAPIYWLSRSLLEPLLHTNLPQYIFNIKRSTKWGILMLPENTVYSDNEVIDHILFRHTLKGETLDPINFKGRQIKFSSHEEDRIFFMTITHTGIVCTGAFGFKMHSKEKSLRDIEFLEEYSYTGIEVDNLGRLIENIILQTLLFIQLQPDSVTTGSFIQSQPTNGFFNFRQQSSINELWNPDWIGKNN